MINNGLLINNMNKIINKLIWIPPCIVVIFCIISVVAVYRHNYIEAIISFVGFIFGMLLMNTIIYYKQLRDKELIDLIDKLESQSEKNDIDSNSIM